MNIFLILSYTLAAITLVLVALSLIFTEWLLVVASALVLLAVYFDHVGIEKSLRDFMRDNKKV